MYKWLDVSYSCIKSAIFCYYVFEGRTVSFLLSFYSSSVLLLTFLIMSPDFVFSTLGMFSLSFYGGGGALGLFIWFKFCPFWPNSFLFVTWIYFNILKHDLVLCFFSRTVRLLSASTAQPEKPLPVLFTRFSMTMTDQWAPSPGEL